jgi:hypothetical protein
MAIVDIHRARNGNPMPIMGGNSTSTGAVMYMFGNECQRVITCSDDGAPLRSEEMCLMGGAYWSASYRALPAKVDGDVKYNSTITEIPRIGQEVQCSTDGRNCDLISF